MPNWTPDNARDSASGSIPLVCPHSDGQRVAELLDPYRTGESMIGRAWRFLVDGATTGVVSEVFLNFTITPMRDCDGIITAEVAAREAARARTGAAEQR